MLIIRSPAVIESVNNPKYFPVACYCDGRSTPSTNHVTVKEQGPQGIDPLKVDVLYTVK